MLVWDVFGMHKLHFLFIYIKTTCGPIQELVCLILDSRELVKYISKYGPCRLICLIGMNFFLSVRLDWLYFSKLGIMLSISVY